MVIPAEPIESVVVRRMMEHKAELISRDADTILSMGNRWSHLEHALDANVQLLATEMLEALEAGETVTRTALFRKRRYQSLLAQIRDEIGAYNDWADEFIEGNQLSLGKLGASNAAEAVQLSLMEGGEGVGMFFDRLPISAVETMVGVAGDGGPIHTLLAQAYPMAVEEMTETLIKNTLLGINPRQTAREMMDSAAGSSLTHNLTVARTEQLRVYREAGRQQYKTSGLVESYRRLCAKNTNTCAVCFSLDGEVYPTNEVMHVHPSDRCTMVPNVTGMPQIQYETGEEWLRKQSPEVQEEILGKGAHELWQNGDIELSDLAKKVDHEIWGPSLQRTPLRDLKEGEIFADVIGELDDVPFVDTMRTGDVSYIGTAEEIEIGGLGGMNESYMIEIEGEQAILKPGIGKESGWALEAEAEAAYYELSEELGFGIVPETVVRDAGTYKMPDGNINERQKASMQRWVNDATVGGDLVGGVGVSERTYSQMTLMDTITAQYDRHSENWLRGLDGDLVAIDNGIAFFDMVDEGQILNDRLEMWSTEALRFHPDDIDAVDALINNTGVMDRIAGTFGEDVRNKMIENGEFLVQRKAYLVDGIKEFSDLI